MNIFYLDHNPLLSAQYHCDKHVCKMIVEYAQMLSTAHRIVDGAMYIEYVNGRRIKRWALSEEDYDDALYKATHVNHPCNVWIRESKNNYAYVFDLFYCLLKEYTKRYNRKHASERLLTYLNVYPEGLKFKDGLSPKFRSSAPPLCMPEEYHQDDHVEAYREFYRKDKAHFCKWNKSVDSGPDWFYK